MGKTWIEGVCKMICKVSQGQESLVRDYLQREPEFNLFILGDLANHGLKSEFVELWVQYDADGSITAVLLRFFGSYVVTAQGRFDECELADFLAGQDKIRALSGKDEVVSLLLPHLDSLNSGKLMHFARLSGQELAPIPAKAKKWCVNRANLADLGRIAILRAEIFTESKVVVRQMLQQGLASGAGRCYFIEHNGEIAATAQTTAEYEKAAMVVGVATALSYRRMGMATACMYKLCQDLLTEGKTLCLFYDNPDAGVLYHRLGFEDIGYWRMAAARKD